MTRSSILASIAICATLCAGCGAVRGAEVKNVDAVVAKESSLIGKSVTVTGYLRFGDDSRNVWESREAYAVIKTGDIKPDDPAWNRCITLFNIDKYRNDLAKLNNKNVSITGIIVRRPTQPGEVNLGSCSDLGISVEYVR